MIFVIALIENTPDTVLFICRKAANYNPEPLLLPRVLLSLWALLPLPHAGHGPGPPLPASQLPQSPQVSQTQCCGSGMFIPDPNFFHPGSRICIKEVKYFIKKFVSKLSDPGDPGCSSRIRILIFYPSRIPNPEVKKAPDPRSGSATLARRLDLCFSCYPTNSLEPLGLGNPKFWTHTFPASQPTSLEPSGVRGI